MWGDEEMDLRSNIFSKFVIKKFVMDEFSREFEELTASHELAFNEKLVFRKQSI